MQSAGQNACMILWLPHQILCRIDFVAAFNQPLPARPLLDLAHFGCTAHALLFFSASRSRFTAPDLVHAVRWAKTRVWSCDCPPSNPTSAASDSGVASIFLHLAVGPGPSAAGLPAAYHLPAYVVCTYLPIWRALEDPTLANIWIVFLMYKRTKNYC